MTVSVTRAVRDAVARANPDEDVRARPRTVLTTIWATALLSMAIPSLSAAQSVPAAPTAAEIKAAETIKYDALGRLQSRSPAIGNTPLESYQLDAAGNRLTASISPTGTPKRFEPRPNPAALQAILTLLLED